jgi:hypothetical protein
LDDLDLEDYASKDMTILLADILVCSKGVGGDNLSKYPKKSLSSIGNMIDILNNFII